MQPRHKLPAEHVSSTLTLQQNKLVRRAAQLLIDRHGGNVSAAARTLNRDQSWLAKFMKNGHGASLETATIIARELGQSVGDLLRMSPQPVRQWRDLPGFNEALAQARALAPHTPRVWERVGTFSMPPHPDVVEAWMLLHVVELVQKLSAKHLNTNEDGERRRSVRVRKA